MRVKKKIKPQINLEKEEKEKKVRKRESEKFINENGRQSKCWKPLYKRLKRESEST